MTLAQAGALFNDADTAVSLDNTANAKITSSYNPFTNGTTRTFEGWAWRNATTDTDTLFSSSVAAAPRLVLSSGSQNVVWDPDASAGSSVTWTSAWPGSAQWVHWVLVFNESTDAASLYINGTLVSTQSATDAYNASPGNFQVGLQTGSNPFNGLLDEIAVYESALAADRVLYHYQAGTGTLPARLVIPATPMPGPLTVLVTHQDGYVSRMGADEPDAAWVPQNITWSTRLPGGYGEAGFNLRRRIDEDVPLRLLDEVVILDDSGQTMYEGRIVKLPRQHGDDYLLGVECVGWSSHLLDDPSVPYFFVDRDMSSWQAPGLNRRVQAGTVPWETDYQASVDGQFLRFEGPADIAGGRTVLNGSEADLLYKAPVGTTVAKAMYRGTESNTTNVESARIYTDDNDAISSGTSNTLTLDDTLRTVTFSTAERYLCAVARATAQHTPTAPFSRLFKKLGVYANHGLTSVSISGEPDGFYIDDMLAWVLSRGAPKLNYTTSATSTEPSIQRPPIVVPHACDNSIGTVDRIILDLNKYVIWDWTVYDNRTFYYRPTDPDRLTWEARLDQGIFINLEGDDSERAINGVLVTYTTFDGIQKVAGPPGSGMDVESSLLQDTNAEGTVNAHGYTRKWIDYPINFSLADDSYAPIIGAAYLAQTQLPTRSGDFKLGPTVGHPTKGARPSREVRAGDWLRISDHPADEPRRIIATSYSDDTKETTVSVGNDLNKVDAMLEQAALASRVAVG